MAVYFDEHGTYMTDVAGHIYWIDMMRTSSAVQQLHPSLRTLRVDQVSVDWLAGLLYVTSNSEATGSTQVRFSYFGYAFISTLYRAGKFVDKIECLQAINHIEWP